MRIAWHRERLAIVVMTAVVASASLSAQEGDRPVVTHNAVIQTTLGNVELELYGLDAPKTVRNFVELAQKQFYDGLLFHRVIPSFIVQGGDPLTKDGASRDKWGTGGSSIYGGSFADELNPNAPSYKRGYREGVVAMANRGPNTNTSQFFIVLSDEAGTMLLRDRDGKEIQPRYTIFGRVIEGMSVVRRIAAGKLSDPATGLPIDPVAMGAVMAIEVKPTAR